MLHALHLPRRLPLLVEDLHVRHLIDAEVRDRVILIIVTDEIEVSVRHHDLIGIIYVRLLPPRMHPPIRPVAVVDEGKLLLSFDRLIDQIEVDHRLLVLRMLERRDVGEMREARLEVSAALIDQLVDQLLRLCLRQKLRENHRVDEHLQLRIIEGPGHQPIALLRIDVEAVLDETVDVVPDRTPVTHYPVVLLQKLQHPLLRKRMLLIRIILQDLKYQQIQIFLTTTIVHSPTSRTQNLFLSYHKSSAYTTAFSHFRSFVVTEQKAPHHMVRGLLLYRIEKSVASVLNIHEPLRASRGPLMD